MRKTTIILCVSLSSVIILEQFGVWDSLLLFLLVGNVPGTNLSLSPLAMLACVVLLAGFGSLFILSQTESAPKTSKKTLPKKRYSRI